MPVDHSADAKALQSLGTLVWRIAQNIHDSVEPANGLGRNQGNSVAESQGSFHQRLRGFIACPAPVLARKGSLWSNQRAGILCVSIDKICRVQIGRASCRER